MLLGVLLDMAAEELPAAVGTLGGVRDGVEFVVAHDDLGASAVDHPLHDLKNAKLLAATIDQVTDVNGLPVAMPSAPVQSFS